MRALGARLARSLAPAACVITLPGELGAGKTTLVRGLLRALGWTGPVKSPTYALVEHYRVSSLYFYHFDFYRFDDPDEWETAGFAEYFRRDAVCMVEWPERVERSLPAPDLAVDARAMPPNATVRGRDAHARRAHAGPVLRMR